MGAQCFSFPEGLISFMEVQQASFEKLSYQPQVNRAMQDGSFNGRF